MRKSQQQDGESAYRAIFEGAPIGMWDEDFSDIQALLHDLIQSGIANSGEHLREHPEVRRCVQHVRVRHVNRVARKFYGAETDQQLLPAPPTLFDDTALDAFCQKLAALCRRCQHHCSLTLLNGDAWSSL